MNRLIFSGRSDPMKTDSGKKRLEVEVRRGLEGFKDHFDFRERRKKSN